MRRTTNACDACRARKVKCVYDDSSICQGCVDLKVDCTTDRPRKRRGPPSRYVQELQRRQRAATSHNDDVEQHPASIESARVQEDALPVLEDIAPRPVLEELLSDWFEFIHPLAAVLHHDSLFEQLNNVQSHGVDFVALIASICAATVATLRRRSSDHAPVVTVDRCEALINSIDKHRSITPLTHTKCVTAYNLAVALSTLRGMDHPSAYIEMSKTIAMTSHIIHYDLPSLPVLEQELTKRLYWLLFAANCTLGLHGRPYSVSGRINTDYEVLRPRHLTDRDLVNNVSNQGTWHGYEISYVPGLVVLTNLFKLWHESQQFATPDLTRLQHYLQLVQTSLDHAPPELRWRGGLSRPPGSNFGTDIQMVNLYITQIHIRAFLLDQIYGLASRSDDRNTIENVEISRTNLVNDMLAIIYQVPHDTLEANGNSLITKLRDIGLTLLTDNGNTNLERLLAKLDRLDIRLAGQIDTTSPLTTSTSPGFGS